MQLPFASVAGPASTTKAFTGLAAYLSEVVLSNKLYTWQGPEDELHGNQVLEDAPLIAGVRSVAVLESK